MIDTMQGRSAFIDTNVLAHIVGESRKGLDILKTLREYLFQVVPFRKCVYELYSMIKGTNHRRSCLLQDARIVVGE